MNFERSPTSALRFADIAQALCRALGHAMGIGLVQVVMGLVIYRRIQRVRERLVALEARFLAGLVRSGRAAVVERAAPAGDAGVPRATQTSGVWLPRRFGWLCGLVPGEAASYAGQLRVVLAEPEMVALLAACPQAVRIVRPLCWMLGIERADYVVGEGLVATVAPELVPAATATVAAAVPEMTLGDRLALATAGLSWTRFIPG
jgi:hypothetical protein